MGHTHNQLDGTFGILSRHVYGRQCGGTTGRDVLSFSGFDKVAAHILFLFVMFPVDYELYVITFVCMFLFLINHVTIQEGICTYNLPT